MTQLTQQEINRLKNVSHKQYMYDDWDKDKVKNIDDPKPFDKNVKRWPQHETNRSFYHSSRYGGGEVLLSAELKAIESHANQRVPLLKSFLSKHKSQGAYGRVKTVPSIMKKLRERHLGEMGDVVGATILTERRHNANRLAAQIKRQHTFNPSLTDNYYRTPKGRVHYAHHIGLINKKGHILELQITTHKMADLTKVMHPIYKKGGSLRPFVKKARNLFDKGF